MYYVKDNTYSKDEIYDTINSTINKVSNNTDNELYYLKNQVYTKIENDKTPEIDAGVAIHSPRPKQLTL